MDTRTAVWVSTPEKISKIVLEKTRNFSRKFRGVSAPALDKNPAVKRVVLERVVLADVSPVPNRNEGTFGCSPGTRVHADVPWYHQESPRQTKAKKGQLMNFSRGQTGTKIRCESRLFSQGKKHQNSQKWAKFMNFSFWPFLWLNNIKLMRNLAGQNRQSPIASVQQTLSTLASHSAIPRGTKKNFMSVILSVRNSGWGGAMAAPISWAPGIS